MSSGSSETESAPLSLRDRQREETRRKVFEAALVIFRRDGVDGSRIDDIARLAGVSHGTFYFHFPTKDDVLIELLKAAADHSLAAVRELPEEAPLPEILQAIGSTMAADWQSDPKLFPAVGTVALKLFSTEMSLLQAEGLRSTLATRFETAAARGELSTILPAPILSDFFLVNLFAAALAWSGNPTRIPLESMLEGVARFFLRGATLGSEG